MECFHFCSFASARLVLAREIGIQPGIILMDPGDTAFPRRRLPPLLPATAIVAVRCRCCRRRWQLPLPPLAAVAAGHCHRRRQLPPPLTAVAATVGLSPRHRRPLPLPPAIVADCFHFRRLLPLLPPPPPPPSDATAAASGLCHLRSLPPPPSTASYVDRLRRPLSPPYAMVDQDPSRPPRSVAEALGTREIPAELAAILTAHS